ncbi:MAG: hypothetical protein IIV41_10510 [Akkermansia sp.]|nr:hypothetical protein [Akkermansia sp.]
MKLPRFRCHKPGLLADPVLGSASGHGLAQRLAELINTPNTTAYDKAIDSVYLSLHTGGSKLHHLVDGQHDIFGAFEAASKALPDDTLWQEVMGTAQHLGKDLFSVSGLPIVSLEPGQFHAMSTWLSEHLHIPKDWLGDMLQINSLELFGGVLSTAAVVVGCKQRDVKKLAELAASSGLAGALAANPISMCAAAIALTMAWKQQQEGSAGLKQGLLVGAGTSGAAMATGTAVAALGSGALCTVGGVALSLVVGIYTHRFLSRKVYSGRGLLWRLWCSRCRLWLQNRFGLI